MTQQNRTLALTAAAAALFAILFVYSYTHAGPPVYLPSGKRVLGITPVWGGALLVSLVSLISQLRAKK